MITRIISNTILSKPLERLKYIWFGTSFLTGPSNYEITGPPTYEMTAPKPKRYFINSMSDYKGGEVTVSKDVIRDRLDKTIQKILSHQGRNPSNSEGGLYVGIAGVAYMFYHLSTLPELASKRKEYLKNAFEYTDISLQYFKSQKHDSDMATTVGFLLGQAGVYAVSALIFNAMGMKDRSQKLLDTYGHLAQSCIPVRFLRRGADEMFVGRAGYLCGLILLKRQLGIDVVNRDTLFTICTSIINSGRDYVKKNKSPSSLMYAYYDTEYLGAAHGMAGILFMLLSFPEFLKAHSDIERDVKGAVDFMLSLQQPNGNFPTAMDEVTRRRSENDELVHWCHGAPGIVYLMAKAYLHWHDEKYLKSCLKCGDLVWNKGLLRKGPGICHGVAGNGYVFLLLYRLTHDKKHLYRAYKFGDFMYTEEFRRGARVPDRPFSLFEGLSGTACFLADLLDPEHAEYPLFNVF